MEIVLHRQLLRESSTLLEPAQFVFSEPNGREAVSDDDAAADDDDVNKKQFVHRQLHQKSENSHSTNTFASLRNSCTVQTDVSFLFRPCHWFKNMKCFLFTCEESLSLETALGSVLLL